jgi:hypothetical protein
VSLLFYKLVAGATNQDIPIMAYDNTSSTGAKRAGLVFNSSGWKVNYRRQGAAGSTTAITMITKTRGTWASCGFIAFGSTTMPGTYEFGIPNAALNTGANWVDFQFSGASKLVPIDVHIDLAAPSVNVIKLAGTVMATARAGYAPADLRYVTSTALAGHTAGYLPTDLRLIASTTLATHAAGAIAADLRYLSGTALSGHAAGMLPGDLRDIASTTMVTHLAGAIPADLRYLSGTAFVTHAAGMVPGDLRYIASTTLATHAAGMVPADLRDVAGAALGTAASGYVPADVRYLSGTALVSHTAGALPGDVRYLSSTALGSHASGEMPADLRYILGTAASPSSTAGILDVNVRKIANAAVNTASAQVGVNVVNLAGTVMAGARAGYVPGDLRYVGSVALVGHAAGTVPVDVQYLSGTLLAAHAAGQMPSDVRDLLGTAMSPGSTAGIMDVNVRKIANATVNTSLAQVGAKVVGYVPGITGTIKTLDALKTALAGSSSLLQLLCTSLNVGLTSPVAGL